MCLDNPTSLQSTAKTGKLLPASKIAMSVTKAMKPSDAASKIVKAKRVGAALKNDSTHRAASYLTKNQLAKGRTYLLTNQKDKVHRTLLQVKGELNGKKGIYEYLLEPNNTVSHERFIKGGKINGIVNQSVKK